MRDVRRGESLRARRFHTADQRDHTGIAIPVVVLEEVTGATGIRGWRGFANLRHVGHAITVGVEARAVLQHERAFIADAPEQRDIPHLVGCAQDVHADVHQVAGLRIEGIDEAAAAAE